MARPIAVALLVAAVTLIHPGAAYSLPGDPPAGSPGGVVYELPLERGRLDAAPKRGGGAAGGGSTAASGGETSLYRTENNFGSSTIVPGTVAGTGVGAGQIGDAGGGGGGGGGSAGAGEAGRPGGGRPGDGTGGDAEGGAAVQGDLNGESAEQTAGVSVAADIGLLGAIAVLAALSGIAAGRVTRADRAG